jgi:hypothetical protein
MVWRTKRLVLQDWTQLQERFGELQTRLGGPENLAMFSKSHAGDADAAIFITGTGIETIEAFSPNGWEDSGPPRGQGVALLVGAGDPWTYFAIERNNQD